MERRKLPIGIQTFRTIREDGCYYVDKTAHIKRLIGDGNTYFLSRPRRFGKSLLLDTIAELFKGSEDLFRGLAIHPHWDWSVRSPVVRIDFSAGAWQDLEGVNSLENDLDSRLTELQARHGVTSVHERSSAPRRFTTLLRAVHERTGERAVVLIDEYDKPILDVLEDPDTARANRGTLQSFYSAIKAADAHVRFVLLTGVSRFSKVNLFSGLNNLRDITLDPRYSSICGYTEDDLDDVFAPELPGLDRRRIRDWYNGYGWLGNEKVYNPFDVLLLFATREFEAHWFETGTPTFLVEHLLRSGFRAADMDGLTADKELLSSLEVDGIAPEALLFQTGYLTILEKLRRSGRTRYRLGYPNREVRQSLNWFWVQHVSGRSPACRRVSDRLDLALHSGEAESLRAAIHALFSEIPYLWHVRNRIGDFEGFYASVFYSHMAAFGYDLQAEPTTSRGRVDLALLTPERIYLFEFKVIEGEKPTGDALRQMQERGYADAWQRDGRPVLQVGVEFSKATRNVVEVKVE